jgi:hypothetical protein
MAQGHLSLQVVYPQMVIGKSEVWSWGNWLICGEIAAKLRKNLPFTGLFA